jgi:hypothetical protein
VHKDIFLIQKWAFKYKYYTYALQSSNKVSYALCLPHLGVCGGCSPPEIVARAEKVFRAIGNLDRRTPVRELHVTFKIPYVYDYITKLCRTQAEAILNHVNPNVRGIRQVEARHR